MYAWEESKKRGCCCQQDDGWTGRSFLFRVAMRFENGSLPFHVAQEKVTASLTSRRLQGDLFSFTAAEQQNEAEPARRAQLPRTYSAAVTVLEGSALAVP